MEFIIGFCIIIVLLFIAGVSIQTIITGVFLLLCAVLAMIFIFFCYSLLLLALSKKAEGAFVKVDKSPKGEFKVAYYNVKGEEYPCAFPAEPFFQKKFYPQNAVYRLRILGKSGRVYDKYAVITCITGFLSSTALVSVLVYIMFFYA